MPEGDTMNMAHFEGKGIDREGSDFPGRDVAVLRGAEDSGAGGYGIFSKDSRPDLPEYMGELPDYLCMIFVEDEVDKRSRMYKAVKNAGAVVEFPLQDERTLMRWVLGILTREGKKITQRDMELFLMKTGTDMTNIEMELEKLLAYTMGRDVVTAGDIEDICTNQITNRIFEMVRAVSEQNQKKALDLYYDLLSLKEPPMRILFLLARQFNMMLQVKDMQRLGFDQKGIADKLGIQSFIVRNYASFARKYSMDRLRQAVEDFTRTEEDVKTGKLQDVMSVELMIVKYSAAG